MGSPEKLLAVFGLFTLEEPQWTVEAAAERLGLGISTAYRFFKSLSEAGLISAFAPGRYVLGPAIVQLDRQTRLLDPLITAATPIMRRVVEDLRMPGVLLLCRLYRQQVMCIHQAFVDRPSSAVSYERGRLMPLYRGAASRAILANLPARSVRALYDAKRAEMIAAGYAAEWGDVKTALRRLRSARVCVTWGELDIGMIGLAAPLHDPLGTVDASLGFVAPHSDVDATRADVISAELSRAAHNIDTELVKLVRQPDAGVGDQTPSYSQATPSKDCSGVRPASI